MEPERTGAGRRGSSGTNGGDRAAVHFSPGVSWLGEVHPKGGTGQAGFLRQVGRRCEAPEACKGGRASRAQPPAPESTFNASPAPHDKMATWTEGEPGPRGWGEREGRREEAETKRRPPKTTRPACEPGAAGGQGRQRRTRPAEGTGLLFLVVRAAGALHGESVPAMPSRPAAPRGSLRPKRWLPPHAGRESRGTSRGARRETPREPRGRRSRRQSLGCRLGSKKPPLRLLVRARPESLAEAAATAILASPQTSRLCARRS